MLTSEGKDGVFWGLLRMSILAKAKCQAWPGRQTLPCVTGNSCVKVDRNPSELPANAKAQTMSRCAYFEHDYVNSTIHVLAPASGRIYYPRSRRRMLPERWPGGRRCNNLALWRFGSGSVLNFGERQDPSTRPTCTLSKYAILTNLPTCRQRVCERASPHTKILGGRFAVALRLTVVVGPGIGLAGRNIKTANPGRSGPSRRSAAGSNTVAHHRRYGWTWILDRVSGLLPQALPRPGSPWDWVPLF